MTEVPEVSRAAISRRDWVKSMSAAALAPALGIVTAGRRWRLQPMPIRVSGLHSVTLAVSDVERSVAFYQQVFGLPVIARNGSTTVLGLRGGPRFLALSRADARGPRFASFGMAVRDFDLDRVARTLAEHGVEPGGRDGEPDPMRMVIRRRDDTPELFFGDPHGVVVQLHHERYCAGGGPQGSSAQGLRGVRY